MGTSTRIAAGTVSTIEQARIDMAIEVLREALDRAEADRADTKAVQLALRVLRRHVDDLWLRQYWTTASRTLPGSSLWQNLNASLNGIERNLAVRRRR